MDTSFYTEKERNVPVADKADVLNLNITDVQKELRKQGVPDHN